MQRDGGAGAILIHNFRSEMNPAPDRLTGDPQAHWGRKRWAISQ